MCVVKLVGNFCVICLYVNCNKNKVGVNYFCFVFSGLVLNKRVLYNSYFSLVIFIV